MSFLNFKNKTFVGIDIQDDEIRLLRLSKTPEAWQIDQFACEALPYGLVMDGKIIDKQQASLVLQELVKKTHSKKLGTYLALPAHAVFYKTIMLPNYLSTSEYETEIAHHLPDYLPEMKEKVNYDFSILDKKQEDVEILLVAAKSEDVNDYLQLAAYSSLKVKRIELDSYALARAYFFSAGKKQQTAGLVDFQKNKFQFILIHQSKIFFHKTSIFLNDLDFFSKFHSMLEFLFATEKIKIEVIYAAGHHDNFVTLIEKKFAISTTVFDPFCSMRRSIYINESEFEKIKHRFFLSCGLALGNDFYDRN